MRPWAAVWLVAVWLAAAPSARALEPGRPLTRHDERRFGVQDGLPEDSVHALAQTADGYLWIGTDGGLGRYDGHRFTRWTGEDTPALRIHRVRALLVDRDGDLWVGTSGGAGLIRYRQGRFETFEHLIGAGGAVSSALEDSRGRRWFGSFWGVIEHADGKFVKHRALGGEPIRDAKAIVEDAHGAIWFGTKDGVVRWADGVATRFRHAGQEPVLRVAALLAEPDGGVLVGSEDVGLFRFAEGRLSRVPVQGPPAPVNSLTRDRAGTTWVATGRGLARVVDGRLEPAWPTTPESTSAVLEDREGNLWVGTPTAGVVRLSHGPFASVPLEGLGGRRVLAVAGAPDGTVYAGSHGGGLVRLGPDGQRRFTRDEGLCTNVIWSLAVQGAGVVWVGGTLEGQAIACAYDPGAPEGRRLLRTVGRADALPLGYVRAITPMDDGVVWIGTTDGLFEVTPGHVRKVVIPRIAGEPPRGEFAVYAIHRHADGSVWLAGNRGLLVRRGGAWTHLGSLQGLSNGLAFSLEEDGEGAVWVGSLTGFSRVWRGQVTGWRGGRGFRDEAVFKVLPDAAGDLWLCAARGLLRIGRRDLEAYEARRAPLRYTHHGRDDGMAADRCEGGEGQSAGWRHPSGRLYFPSGGSVASLDPARRSPGRAPPRSLVEEIRIDGRPPAPAPEPPPPGRGDLQISYTAPVLSLPNRVRFRYRLDPFDADWVDAGRRRVAYYTQVPPGRYQFRVAAAYDDGPFGETAVADVWLSPFFWQTLWFRALALLSAAGLVAAAVALWHRRRIRALEAQHQVVIAERSRIARDLHDTLAQGFTGISVQLEAATAWMGEDDARAQSYLDRARALVRSSLSDARRAVWDLREESGTSGALVARLSSMARQLSGQVAIRVQVHGRPRPLPSDYEEALVRIGQEALTNGLRHAGASNIAVEISFLDDAVHLSVVDDGRGFDPEGDPVAPGHFGLRGIRERAAALGAALTIGPRAGAGTEVVIKAPLPRGAQA